MREKIVLFAAALSLAGCATVMEGTGQSLAISTTPPGALCKITRQGGQLGEVASTPGSIRVDKSGKDISVTCSEAGYQTATVTRSPRFQGTTFGNIILGGGIGAIVDASTGANYEYPGEIALALAPITPPARPATAVVIPQPVALPKP